MNPHIGGASAGKIHPRLEDPSRQVTRLRDPAGITHTERVTSNSVIRKWSLKITRKHTWPTKLLTTDFIVLMSGLILRSSNLNGNNQGIQSFTWTSERATIFMARELVSSFGLTVINTKNFGMSLA
ncbi:hypothetical protein A2U01_0037574 [Trifolium medium]|uniref:Uncharacterized protein n=1 Tax=Trifolium medium TaxID=97028 RepID=A0A392PXS0_9FABA|nr:hypothetical protein [Trifolium medium]